MTPRLGLVLPLFSGNVERVMGAAREAESLGYDGVFAFDHFFPPGAAPDRPSLEAFTTLAAVGAVTSRVAVGTLVVRAQLRPPGLLAKMAAGLDDITGGRMILAIGTGDPIDEPEHRAFGIPTLSKAERRVHLAEVVAAVKALFRGDAWEGGDQVPPIAGPLLPPPVRPGGPPVWIGAQADPVVRLAGAVADGWNGWGASPGEFARKATLVAEEAGAAGREVESTWAGIALVGEDEAETERLATARRERGMSTDDIWIGSAARFAEHVHALGDAGATWVIVVAAGPTDRAALIARSAHPA
ncbi:MAG TPA: LLM class flavin-dependent oxidoreductase [Actinomycetota bacterium]|jgi:alkanesulfonate monooxygenase SsuD/methylene tetrahydromethanopterin reductase-like flavin-dependent oxidoreductase (luciferase family)